MLFTPLALGAERIGDLRTDGVRRGSTGVHGRTDLGGRRRGGSLDLLGGILDRGLDPRVREDQRGEHAAVHRRLGEERGVVLTVRPALRRHVEVGLPVEHLDLDPAQLPLRDVATREDQTQRDVGVAEEHALGVHRDLLVESIDAGVVRIRGPHLGTELLEVRIVHVLSHVHGSPVALIG